MTVMIVLSWKYKKRNVLLRIEPEDQQVGVVCQSGDVQLINRCGFISRSAARKTGRPVKLKIDQVGFEFDLAVDWHDVPQGQHV